MRRLEILVESRKDDHRVESLGSWLRAHRERKDISLRRVADETRIALRYLEAIEADDWSRLPADVFVRGFVSGYATAIGVDHKEALRRFRDIREAGSEPAVGGESWNAPRRSARILAAITAVLLIAVIAWWFGRDSRTDQEGGTEPAFVGKTVHLEIQATDDVVVTASIDGRRTVEDLLRRGQVGAYDATERVEFGIDRPDRVRVKLNGRRIQLSAFGGGTFAATPGGVSAIDESRHVPPQETPESTGEVE